MGDTRLAALVASAIILLGAGHATAQVAQGSEAAGHESHGAAPQPALPHDSTPPPPHPAPLLPEGRSLDQTLDDAAKPTPRSFGKPVADSMVFSFTQFELLEYRVSNTGRGEFGFDSNGWIGTDHDKFWWKAEGDMSFESDNQGDVLVQGLYATPISSFWFFQTGIAYERVWGDKDGGQAMGVLGLQGIAPFQIDVEPALFITQDGQVLADLTASYYLYLTQRLVLQPRVELHASAQDDPELGYEAGVNFGDFSLRLLYEFSRGFAPYVGVRYYKLFGETAQLARRSGEEDEQSQLVFGVRLTF